MPSKVLALAKLTWLDLWSRGVGLSFLAINGLFLIAPNLIRVAGSTLDAATELALSELSQLRLCLSLALNLGIGLAAYLAVGSVEREVSQRTLTAVLVRPLSRRDYLLGRVLGLAGFFVPHVSIALAIAGCLALTRTTGLASRDAFDALIALVSGLTWILMALPLAAISSTRTALVLLTVPRIIPGLLNALPGDRFPLSRAIVAAAGQLTCPELPEFGGSPSMNAALTLAAALAYALAFFIACAWVYERQDPRLRP